jgi:hypothetical protein
MPSPDNCRQRRCPAVTGTAPSSLSPERVEDRGRDVLGAVHRWRSTGEYLEFTELGCREWGVCRDIGLRADGCDQPRGEVAPITEVRRKGRAHFNRAEFEEPVAGSSGERGLKRVRKTGRRLCNVVRGTEEKAAARSQRE